MVVLGAAHPQTATFPRQLEYCSLLDKCDLEAPAAACPDSLKAGVEGVDYQRERCPEARELLARGISTDGFLGRQLFGFLGQRYRVDYPITDSLPVKAAALEYLLNDIPLAAKLVNAFQGTRYHVEYLDGDRKRIWRGDNGKNLSGEATLISGDVDENRLIYFGFGVVKILKWRLRGRVLFDYAYGVKPDGTIAFDLSVLVFPGGPVINSIMNLGIFKRVVRSKILEVFEDISDSAGDLSASSPDALKKKYDWSPGELAKLAILQNLL